MKIINNTNPDEIISELNNSIKISTEHLNKYKKQKIKYNIIAILLILLQAVIFILMSTVNHQVIKMIIPAISVINPLFIIGSLFYISNCKSSIKEKKYFIEKKNEIINSTLSKQEKAEKASKYLNRHFNSNDFNKFNEILNNKKIKKAILDNKTLNIDYVDDNKEIKKLIISVDIHYFENLIEPSIEIKNK